VSVGRSKRKKKKEGTGTDFLSRLLQFQRQEGGEREERKCPPPSIKRKVKKGKEKRDGTRKGEKRERSRKTVPNAYSLCMREKKSEGEKSQFPSAGLPLRERHLTRRRRRCKGSQREESGGLRGNSIKTNGESRSVRRMEKRFYEKGRKGNK